MSRVPNRSAAVLNAADIDAEGVHRGLHFTMIAPSLIRNPAISRDAKALYALIATYADVKERDCYPSRARLARELNCTARSVTNWLNELVLYGVLAIEERRREDGGRSSNLYRLLDGNMILRDAKSQMDPDWVDAPEVEIESERDAAMAVGRRPAFIKGDDSGWPYNRTPAQHEASGSTW